MYKGVFNIFTRYWRAYGGLSAMLRSPYLHGALLLLVLTANTWLHLAWWDSVVDALPNLLGFTLGGFAIFIGFGDESFRAVLSEPDSEDDPKKATIYVSLCATFVHFIVVQISALIFALVAGSLNFYSPLVDGFRYWIELGNILAGAVGYLLYLYALTSVLAATMHVFRIASMYESFKGVQVRNGHN